MYNLYNQLQSNEVKHGQTDLGRLSSILLSAKICESPRSFCATTRRLLQLPNGVSLGTCVMGGTHVESTRPGR